MESADQSKKLRALRESCDTPLEQVARTAALSAFTHEELAERWTIQVRRSHPELNLRFTETDVCRLFRKHGVSRRGPRKAVTS